MAATYSASLEESVTPPWRQLRQLIGAQFRAMTYPVMLRRVSESAAKSLSTHPVKMFGSRRQGCNTTDLGRECLARMQEQVRWLPCGQGQGYARIG